MSTAAVEAGPVRRRLEFVDNAKAVGIVLIVAGHTFYASTIPNLMILIFGFHVPLFFFISGMLLAPARLPLPDFGRRLRDRLLGPYVFFFGLSYVYWLSTRRFSQSGVHASDPWWQPFIPFVSGSGVFSANQPLWFFWGLASTALLFEIARRVMRPPVIVVASLGLGLLLAAYRDDSMPRLPFALDCAAVALFFYAAGHWLSARIASSFARLSRLKALALGCLVAAIYVFAALANGRVDMQRLQFGASSSMYFPVALVGICALLLLCASFPSGRLTRWLSFNTLYIFPSHALALSIMTGVLYFGLRMSIEQIHHSACAAVASVVVALAFAVPFVPETRAWMMSRTRA